jgi:sulfofructose kinase
MSVPPLDVAGLGISVVDDLLLLSNFPPPEGRATILRRERQGGGMVATATVAVARLGGRAGMMTAVGDDAAGRFIVEDFRRHGVDVSRIGVQPGATSHVTVVLVDATTGTRTFLAERGSVAALAPEQLDRAYVTGARILHLSDAGPAAIQAARWAKAAGREVCLDGTHYHPAVDALLPSLDYLVVSRFFASEFVAYQEGRGLSAAARRFAALGQAASSAEESPAAGRAPPAGDPAGVVPELSGAGLLAAAGRLHQLGVPVVVVTEGEHGSWCVSPDGEAHIPAFAVPVVDTTGAGDVYHGAFLFARARGWDVGPALRLASAVAALKCQALGGRAGIPRLEEAQAMLRQAGSRRQ